jgi:NAD/NADP transhydrogenase beta subunit
VTTAGVVVATLDHMDRSNVRRTAAVMAFVAVTLFIASAVHLVGLGTSRAGIPELIIGVVLATAAAVMAQEPVRARAVGMGAVGFAIAGFGVGLTRTVPSGHAAEIAYHVLVLPILIGLFTVLVRTGKPRDARRAPAAD